MPQQPQQPQQPQLPELPELPQLTQQPQQPQQPQLPQLPQLTQLPPWILNHRPIGSAKKPQTIKAKARLGLFVNPAGKTICVKNSHL